MSVTSYEFNMYGAQFMAGKDILDIATVYSGRAVLRGGLGYILHAHQRVSTVWAAQDTGGKHYGQGVRRHAVVSFLFRHSAIEPSSKTMLGEGKMG